MLSVRDEYAPADHEWTAYLAMTLALLLLYWLAARSAVSLVARFRVHGATVKMRSLSS
jgi:hypothetical protein